MAEFDKNKETKEKENARVYIGVMDYLMVPASGIY